jgi:hypothetical protein
MLTTDELKQALEYYKAIKRKAPPSMEGFYRGVIVCLESLIKTSEARTNLLHFNWDNTETVKNTWTINYTKEEA